MEDRYLFKAKRIDNGEWEIGSLIALPTGEYEISNKCNNPPDCDPMWDRVVITHKVDPSTICQCTGLKDENGKLIWENDIVVCRDFTEENYVISWKQDEACFEYQQYGCSIMNFEQLSGCEVEVIGNKFDNPELLEV